MVICESFMFEFNVYKEWEKKINNRIPTHLLAYLLTLIVKELKISGNNIKYNQNTKYPI